MFPRTVFMNKTIKKRGRNALLLALVSMLHVGINQSASIAQTPAAPVAKKADKSIRIFVDKVHPAHGDLSQADLKQLADAGFTHVANLWRYDNNGKPNDVKRYSERAAQAGIGVYKWDYGLVKAKEGGTRHLNRLGKETRYAPVLDEQGWQELTQKVLDYARLSRENPNFKGVLLDFEVYEGSRTDGFSESFDDQTMQRFITELGLGTVSELPAPEKRKAWMESREWYQLYLSWQLDKVGRNVRNLRKAIDAVNPNFQIGVYGWGGMISPFIREFATPQAPVLILSAMTYGRSVYSNAFVNGYDGNRPDAEALKWSLETVQNGARYAHERYDNVIYLGGHYPQSPGPADGMQFKFTAKQAFQSAAFGEGYWIWTDWVTPKPWTSQKEWYDAMIAYFGKANAAVMANDTTWAQREPATVP
jgi:hypothetical protein